MSGLAKMVISGGGKVSGSDINYSSELSSLQSMGADIYIGHNSKNITSEITLVVFSGAIHDNNPEIIRAKQLSIPLMERSEFLGVIAREYTNVIAISGTHGKTTTTAMIAHIFASAGLNPTIHLGGVSNNFGTNTVIGGKEYLIVEACEYRESFRFLSPDTLIITNIECDHLDYYRDLGHIKQAFANLASNSRDIIVLDNIDINHPSLLRIGVDYVCNSHSVSRDVIDYEVSLKDGVVAKFRLNCIGEYNITNSLFAIATAIKYGISLDIIIQAISSFAGVERRYEKIASISQVPIYIDYAHHPTEISNSISAISSVYSSPLVIFQPHTYSRTLKLFEEFLQVLSFDGIVLFETYPARENEIIGGRSIDLFDSIKASNKVYCQDIDWLYNYIDDNINNGNCDSVLILGAGDLALKLKNKYPLYK